MLLTRQDIADRLQVSPHRAGDYMQQMQRVVLPGGRVRVTEQALETWLQAHTVQPPMVAEKPRKKMATMADWRDALAPPSKKKSPA